MDEQAIWSDAELDEYMDWLNSGMWFVVPSFSSATSRLIDSARQQDPNLANGITFEAHSA